ncbi:YdeI/OmpD-associated family protein [Marivirga sp.]|uniref:YdeI/OmpD-associated family protein n=1 Tax=Marivirga sp. TaxID=2018662 RepID=UPI002D7EDFC7|nr:YdeI/OmpD-associated family protein [Marivirga sp.]HET8858503.1 YdeI/OmpD-associated family protein [Marivirga sp.]
MEKNSKWLEELELLRSIIRKTELEKTTKWGGEVYTFNKGNVLSIAGFKNYVSLWFFNGVFLKDPFQVLGNSQEGKTKALRYWQFTSLDEMEEEKILQYIQEAIENEKKGLKWKAEKSSDLEIPEIFSNYLTADKSLKSTFENLTPFKQKEYIEYISSAKRDATKVSRIEKIIPMILEGIGLNDKYRK